MSEKEENKYLYDRLTNAYAVRTKAAFFGKVGFDGSASADEQVGPSAVRNNHSKKNGPLIGIVLLVALLICFAIFFGFLRW